VVTPEHIRTVYGCDVIIDRHPEAGTPRVTLPQALEGRAMVKR